MRTRRFRRTAMIDKKISARRRETKAHSPKGGKVVKIRTEGRNLGVWRTFAIGIFILLQTALILLFYLGVISYFRIYQLVAFIFSFICCIHVLSTSKPGHTKTVWVLFLLLFNSFGYIAYLMSSERIFFGWAKRRYNKIFKRTEGLTCGYVELTHVCSQVRRDAEYLWNAGRFPAYCGSALKYFASGASMFDDVLDELEKAEKFIFIEFFIIADGVLLNRFFDVLSKKVKEGVDVRIICDGMGSHGTLSFKMQKKLRKAGVKLFRFNRIVPRFTFALNVRDHRKIIVIDGKTAYTGGCNLADEYINEKRMHGYWKDSGIKASGGAASGFTLMFLRQWEFVSKKSEDYNKYVTSFENVREGAVAVPYADGKDYESFVCKGVYSNIMAGAREKLYIMTPYFIPDEDTAALLAQKALSGVDVRIVLPEVPDKAYVYRVSVDSAERLLQSGVRVFKMRHTFVHSKVVFSENCVSVSSVNIDLRSYYNQFENGIYTNDNGVLCDVLRDFENVFKVCSEITGENSTRNKLFPRMVAGILRVFSPLM